MFAGAPVTLAADEAPELLALVRFLRDRPGSEALGLGMAAFSLWIARRILRSRLFSD